uniref:Helicase ATP-binding domain-containing protein n=1 Tax=Caenorhabditis japonica TaxID=281687 RepID=A0A8R1IQY6_CAEJA
MSEAVFMNVYRTIYIWSFETGHLLDILSGHESAISSLDIHSNYILSGSWDRTVKVWTIVDSQAESVELSHEALDVKFSPSGELFAVLSSDGVITFFEPKDMLNLGTIDTKLDVDPARGSRDVITRQSSAKSKMFTKIRFSPDGNLILAGGESNNFCLYSVPDKMILRKFKITENRSLDGVVLDFNRRNFTEFGNMNLVDTSDDDDDEEIGNKMSIKVKCFIFITKPQDCKKKNSKLNIFQTSRFSEPTEIQSAVLPAAVRDRQDILGAAETGSGKTLAFGIPLVARLLEKDDEESQEASGPRALIIAPTRELVIQIMKHITALIAHTELKATSIVGGLAQVKQERVISQRRPDIIVATPGRLWAMMQEAETASYLSKWSDLKCLVVDETDRMVEEGYFNELTHILHKVHE